VLVSQPACLPACRAVSPHRSALPGVYGRARHLPTDQQFADASFAAVVQEYAAIRRRRAVPIKFPIVKVGGNLAAEASRLLEALRAPLDSRWISDKMVFNADR